MSRSESPTAFAERMTAAVAKARGPKAAQSRPAAEASAEAPPNFAHLGGGDPAAAFAAASREAMAKVRGEAPTKRGAGR